MEDGLRRDCTIEGYLLAQMGDGLPDFLYNLLSRHADKTDVPFTLTKEQHAELIQENCIHCGGSPTGGYNVIIRVDDDEGYTIENSLPCCGPCCRMKDGRSIGEFVQQCVRVAEHTKKLLKEKE